jgi:hypothetical protein
MKTHFAPKKPIEVLISENMLLDIYKASDDVEKYNAIQLYRAFLDALDVRKRALP